MLVVDAPSVGVIDHQFDGFFYRVANSLGHQAYIYNDYMSSWMHIFLRWPSRCVKIHQCIIKDNDTKNCLQEMHLKCLVMKRDLDVVTRHHLKFFLAMKDKNPISSPDVTRAHMLMILQKPYQAFFADLHNYVDDLVARCMRMKWLAGGMQSFELLSLEVSPEVRDCGAEEWGKGLSSRDALMNRPLKRKIQPFDSLHIKNEESIDVPYHVGPSDSLERSRGKMSKAQCTDEPQLFKKPKAEFAEDTTRSKKREL